jgi:hypothetical protein
MLFRIRTSFALLAFALLAACGGSDDYWDEFQPRAATVDDIASGTFVFTDFSYGAVFDASLSRSTTTLAFGAATPDGSAHRLPFTLSANGTSASGTATLSGADLSLAFARVGAGLPFSTEVPLDLEIEADVDDGRIGLTNPASGIAQVCAPL